MLVTCNLSCHSCACSRRTGGGGLVDRCHRTDGRTFTGRSASVGADTESQIHPLAASKARTPASAGTLGSLDRVSRHFVRCELLRVPATVDDDRVAVSARLESSSSRRVLSGDILAASGVQRTAVQRPPTLRLIKRVSIQYSVFSIQARAPELV